MGGMPTSVPMQVLDQFKAIVAAYRNGSIKAYVAHEQIRTLALGLNLGLAEIAFAALLELNTTQRRLADAHTLIESKSAELLVALVAAKERGQQVRDLGRALQTLEARMRAAQS